MSDEAKQSELTEQETKRILDLMDKLQQSGFSYLKMELGDLKLTLGKQAGPALSDQAPAPVSITTAPTPATPSPPAVQDSVDTSPAYDPEALEGHVISAPMVGRFYRAPQPGDPPFTEVGAEVNEGTTLCIIEVMKVFSAITSDVRGVVTKILVEDGDLVEYMQPLFVIKPAEETQG
jgi:acetyl-CoA carboxylase biotin carboxyl carrier protein